MRKTFPGYYRPTDDEFKQLWDECIFVFDANVLLNIYRYTEATREDFLKIVRHIQGRLWIPHQAALEYQRNRLTVIQNQIDAYENIQEVLRESRGKLETELNGFKRHAYIDVEQILAEIGEVITNIEDKLEEQQQEHPDLLENDPLHSSLTELLADRIGVPFSQKRLNEIYALGKQRYANEVPPGYEDEKKKPVDKRAYGDLVLWFQIVEHAREMQSPIILATDDRKEDWWWKHAGKTIGPRPELTQEIKDEADVQFYMYPSDRFMERAREYLDLAVEQQAIDEVREIREADENAIANFYKLMKQLDLTATAMDRIRSSAALDGLTDVSRRLNDQLTIAYPDIPYTKSDFLEQWEETTRQLGGVRILDFFDDTIQESLSRSSAVIEAYKQSESLRQILDSIQAHVARINEAYIQSQGHLEWLEAIKAHTSEQDEDTDKSQPDSEDIG